MALGEYRTKENIRAYQFTDPCGDIDGLIEFGLQIVHVVIKANGPNRSVFLCAFDKLSKCLFEARLNDYIIAEEDYGKTNFIAMPKEKFEQIYEPVGNGTVRRR